MKRWFAVSGLGLLATLLGGAQPAMAQTVLAASHFDADREGWVAQDLGSPNPGAPPVHLATYIPTYQSTGGNPGGHLQLGDPTGNAWYWYAPGAFLGNKSSAYGGTLSYQLKVTGGTEPFTQPDVILVGGGLTLVRGNLAPPGSVSFNSYQLNLSETGWTRNALGGVAATDEDMKTVLGNLSHLYIRGEYRAGTDTGYLDNVVLTSAAPTAVPEPGSLLLFLPALAAVVALRRKQ